MTAAEYKSAFETIVSFVEKDQTTDAASSCKFDSSKFKEIVSSGASGSYFYFTPCRKFIVKQVSVM